MSPYLTTVETCVLLGRESGRDVKYEYIDYVLKDNPSGNKQVRYCDIKAWVEENYGKNRVPKCPPEKVEAIKAAFKHFGIIE